MTEPNNAFEDERFAKEVNATINFVFNIFSSIVGNIASNVAPLTAGLLPAYLTYKHIYETLGYDKWVAWAGAITVEFLGLGSGNELMKIWYHNKYIAKMPEEKLPLFNAGASATWYVLIMVVFNVIMEAQPNSIGWRIFAIALFATLAVPGYMLVSGRTLRIQMEEQAERVSFEQAENERLDKEDRIEQERYAFEHAHEAGLELARQQAENERLQAATELNAKLEMQRLKHEQKMERIRVEVELERERTNRERTENERQRTFVANERTPANGRTNSESMQEIFSIIDRMFLEGNRKVPGQADVCRELSRKRTGTPDGYETYKSYVNKAFKQWQPPVEEQLENGEIDNA